jgi:hypothetical protein
VARLAGSGGLPRFMILRHQKQRRESGQVTLIEFLYFVAGAVLSFWIADILSSHFAGAWHTFILYSVRIIGTLVFGLSLTILSGYIRYYHRRKIAKPPQDDDKPNTA